LFRWNFLIDILRIILLAPPISLTYPYLINFLPSILEILIIASLSEWDLVGYTKIVVILKGYNWFERDFVGHHITISRNLALIFYGYLLIIKHHCFLLAGNFSGCYWFCQVDFQLEIITAKNKSRFFRNVTCFFVSPCFFLWEFETGFVLFLLPQLDLDFVSYFIYCVYEFMLIPISH